MARSQLSRYVWVALWASLLVVTAPARAQSESGSIDSDLVKILERFDEVQQSILTLRAELTMTTINRLLVDPVVYEGHFYMTKPDAVRWDFETPEPMWFVIANDQYVGYYPEQKRAEKKNIKRRSEKLFRYFGLGQGSAQLAEYYDLSLEPDDPEVPGTHLLTMSPKKRRVKKRIDDVRFWVGKQSMLPVKVEYRSTDGNVRIVEFHDMRTNVDIEASRYQVALPADVQVRSGFSPFGGS